MMHRTSALFALTICFLFTAAATAQPPAPDQDDSAPPRPERPRFNVLDQLGPGFSLPGSDDAGEKLFLSARFDLEEDKRVGRLSVTAEMADEWHTYSVTQKPGGPQTTRLKADLGQAGRLTGPFSAEPEPELHHYEFWSVPAEEHKGTVTWTAPLELAENVDPRSLEIPIEFDGQVCKTGGSCIPIKQTVVASFAGTYQRLQATGEFRPELAHVHWQGHVEPQVVGPGGKAYLVLTATPDTPYHIYAYSPENDKQGYAPTLIAISKSSGWNYSRPQTDARIVRKAAAIPGNSELLYHEGPVTWTVPFDVPADAALGEYEITGLIGFQTCTDESCDMPTGGHFRAAVTVGAQEEAGQRPLAFAVSDYKSAEKAAAATASRMKQAAAASTPFSLFALFTSMGFALLGGLILNVMPCVLPVIPLKLLSFVEQAGNNRAKLMAYNLVYAAGTIAVFLALACVGVIFNLGWGEHFGLLSFQVVVTLVMFAMTLSLMGVWEIPLPGAIGSGGPAKVEADSGVGSAFWKGFLTTIYATPCSGPFLGFALGATLEFPAYAKFLVFGTAGIGFALPYIVLGMAMAWSRGLANLLPKPGVWMEHVKQATGFVLLFIVLYYFSQIDTGYRVATLFAAIGVAFACWLVGKVPVYAEWQSKAWAWSSGMASIALATWFAFSYMGPMNAHNAILAWQPYTPAALAEAQAQGKTVLIEFTADWCPTCQVNYVFAINTQAVKEVVDKNEVVTLLADWSDRSAVIKQKLNELNSDSIPLLAVYPASGEPPIVLRDLVIQSQVIAALEQAGPSRSSSQATAMVGSVTPNQH